MTGQLTSGEPAPSSTPLFEASRAGDRAAVGMLLKKGADVQAQNETGESPLMEAALNADAAVLELLLEAGADVNATNKAGATALLRAATSEEKSRVLIAHHADVSARSALARPAASR